MKARLNQQYGAAEIEARLAKRFAAPEYAFMPQMGQGTGSTAGRRADAVAFSLWPSRGLDLSGFEIKISRSDLASEIKNPEKAEAIQRFCDFWWLVTPVGLTSEADMIPVTWGIMEVDGRGVKVKRQAPRLEPQPLTRPIIAAMFRGFHECVPYLRENFVALDDVETQIAERAQKIADSKRSYELHELTNLKKTVARFEEESGINLAKEYDWTAGRIGEVVKTIVAAGGIERLGATLLYEENRLTRAIESIRAAISAIDETKEREA